MNTNDMTYINANRFKSNRTGQDDDDKDDLCPEYLPPFHQNF